MNLHSSSADLTPHLPVRLIPDACPSCGQELPANRLEELTGRIAAREREQAQALTNRLNDQFRAQKEAAEAQATAALEQERRESASREAKAVQAANEAATTPKYSSKRAQPQKRKRTNNSSTSTPHSRTRNAPPPNRYARPKQMRPQEKRRSGRALVPR